MSDPCVEQVKRTKVLSLYIYLTNNCNPYKSVSKFGTYIFNVRMGRNKCQALYERSQTATSINLCKFGTYILKFSRHDKFSTEGWEETNVMQKKKKRGYLFGGSKL